MRTRTSPTLEACLLHRGVFCMTMAEEESTELELKEASQENESSRSSRSPREKIYTVDYAIDKLGFGPFQILITVFCGLLWLADAMELMILSVLSPAVKCQWDLSNTEEALITSIVFLGFFFGGTFWGVIFDIIGRKMGLLIVDLVILLFGLLSALKMSAGDDKLPGYPWLLLCRFGVGFGAAGTSQVVTYFTEFLPVKTRGGCLMLVNFWWAVGTMFGAVLAIGVMRDGGLGWHWYLGLASLPLALVLFLFPFVPESARFYLVKGKNDKAQKVIERIAFFNRKAVPEGRLVSNEENIQANGEEDVVHYSEGIVSIKESNVTSYDVTNVQDTNMFQEDGNSSDVEIHPLLEPDTEESHTKEAARPSKMKNMLNALSVLFSDGMWKTTVLLLFIWLGSAWLYYGIVLLTTTLLRFDPHCGVNMNVSGLCEDSQLDTNDYLKILWTTAAEFPGMIITIILIEILGRKLTMAIEFFISMIGFLLLLICASDTLLTFFLFVIRAFTTGVFQAVYVYTPEVYPTSARAFGLGICTTAARVGAIITPYVAQVALKANDYATISVYAGSCLGLVILALLLPIETKGRALRDN